MKEKEKKERRKKERKKKDRTASFLLLRQGYQVQVCGVCSGSNAMRKKINEIQILGDS